MNNPEWKAVAYKDYGIMHDTWHLNPEYITGKDGAEKFFEWLHRADKNKQIFLMHRRVADSSVFELIVVPRKANG